MQHQSYSLFKKLRSAAKKSIVFTLIFLFTFSPIMQAFAAEESATLVSGNDVIVTEDLSVSNASSNATLPEVAGSADNPANESALLPSVPDNTVNLAAPEKAKDAGQKDKKAKTGDATVQAQTATASSGSSGESLKTFEKARLPQSEGASGALAYNYPIDVPPGRNGMQPDLSLNYNNQAGEEGSMFGYGWSLNIPYIERINRKGTDKLYTENFFNSSLSGELINTSGALYSSKINNGEFLKYEFSNNSWLVTDKKGTKYKFGVNAAARQDDAADTAKTFKWMLEEIRDTNDNYVRYEYFKDAGQIYPSKIIYTGNGATDGIFEVEFLRETRTDAATSYKTGFSVKTNYRINEINTKASGSWAKKYTMTYVAGGNTQRSMLKTIAESGRDDAGNIISLPATSFDYQTNNTGAWTGTTSWKSPVSLVKGAIVADVNGDGLADIMKSLYYENGTNNATVQATYINDGNGGWVENINLKPPVIFSQTNNLYNDDPNNSFDDNDKRVRAIDVNGDGLIDLVQSFSDPYNPGNSRHKIFINNGNGWAERAASNNIPSFGPNSPVHVTDINGDGLPDMISASVCETCNSPAPVYSSVYLNNGNNDWVYDDINWKSPIDLKKGGIVADLNNDGLADIMRSYYWHSVYNHPEWDRIEQVSYLNDGKGGWIENASLKPPVIFYDDFAEAGAYPGETGVRAVDVNGDGLTDLIQSTNVIKKLFINTGNGWEVKNISDIPLFIISTAGTYPAGTDMADINGDGLVDMIQARYCLTCGSNPVLNGAVYLNNGPKTDLLNKINHSKGGNTAIIYKPSAQYTNNGILLNPNLPFALDTVNSITHNDSLGGSYSYNYQYESGKYYFANSFDRRFAGFGKITETDSAGNSVKTYYHQGDATDSAKGEYADHSSKIGKPYRAENLDSAAGIYSTTINKWENYDLGLERNFVKLTQKIEQTYDGNATYKDKAETYTYDDANGNLTEKTQWGEVTGADNGTFIDISTDKLTTSVSYASNASLYILGLPSQETTTDQNAIKIKGSKYYYDGLALGSADKGNLTKEEKWVSGANYINTQKSYNSYGLATQEIDPRGNATNYSYDSYNLYPASVANALNHITQYVYDYSSGKPKQITDPNNYVFQTVYDGFDRPLEEKQPDLTSPATLVAKSAYVYADAAVPTSVKKTDYLDATNGADSYSYFDGLGRIIQTRKEAEVANTFSAADFVYDNRGLLQKESLPYFSSGSAKTAATSDSTLYSVYTYDTLGRITATANAVGTVTNAYDDWKVVATDAKGTPKDLYKDAYGNLIRVDEHNGASIYTTAYNYDAAGNLLKITDAAGNVRNFTYDALDRRLTAEDLHVPADTTFGVWAYSYDANGNLISQLDPKNQTVNYSYDALNRALTEDYAGQAGIETTYVYDACSNGIDRLCSVTNSASAETKEYNALGQIKKETKNIDSVNYITEYNYDRQGNQILLANPDNSQVKYEYNNAGLLEKVSTKENADPNFPRNTNLVGYWNLNEGTGTLASDSSGNGNNGNLVNMTNSSWVIGKSGTALDFNGTNNYVDVGTPSLLNFERTSGFSLSTWVKPTSEYEGAVIAKMESSGNYRGYDLYIDSRSPSKEVIFQLVNTPSNFIQVNIYNTPLDDGLWHHLVSTYDGSGYASGIKLYIDGNERNFSVYSDNLGFNTIQNQKSFTLGSRQDSYRFAGAMDETRIYNRALTQAEVTALYKNPASPTNFTDLATNFDYSPLGKITSQTYANGTTTTNTYDATKLYRLASKVTILSGGTHVQDLVYNYDANGNITKIIDNSATNTKKTIDYTYDGLNRLLSVTATGSINGQNYAESYAYDAIGNITSKNGQAYTYSGLGYANPHAVTSIGAINYTYDNNGNLLSDGTITNTWNYDNRLTQSTIGSSTINYSYDAGGQRIKYSISSKTTIYPSKFYNTDGTIPTKHIFAGNQTIATIKGTGSTAQTYSVSTDHLTGSNVVTNSSGIIEELTDYYPYGDIRLDNKAGVDIATDSSTSGNNGMVNGASWTSGINGNSLDFDGVNDYVQIPDNTSLNITGPLTISAWVYIKDRENFQNILSKGYSFGAPTNYQMGIYGNRIFFDFYSGGTRHSNYFNILAYPVNAWYHIVGVWDGTNARIYLNAQEKYTASIPNITSLDANNYDLYLGSALNGFYLNGKEDEVRIYNRSLTPTEITALYNDPPTINTTNLSGHWKFDEAPFSEQRKFAGHELDTDTGLSYMSTRYYNRKIGRFISQDSLVLNTPEKVLEDPQALNSYAYARNNPLKYVDPTGNFFETAWDVGNLAYDAGRIIKNTVEVNVGLAKYGYGIITKNQALQNSALTQMGGDLGDLKSAGIDAAFDTAATAIPFVPAGLTKVVGKADDAAKFIKNEEKYISKYDDIIPPSRQNHILNGEPSRTGGWSGGHKAGTGMGKPEFPSSWSDNQIFHNAADLATDPSLNWIRQDNKRYIVSGVRDGVNMSVIIDKTGSSIVTAFPKIR